MTKQEFIKCFSHFITESDLNKSFDSHFNELGKMNMFHVEEWLENVLENNESNLEAKNNEWIINVLKDDDFGEKWNSKIGKEFRSLIFDILDKLPCATCRKCKWYFESECRGNDKACKEYVET